jgi:serine phosphatase RsbU (regulator of sigma subunit)
MIREIRIEALSYKNRRIKVGGQWFDASRDFDLDCLRIGEVYKLQILDTIEGRKVIDSVVEE